MLSGVPVVLDRLSRIAVFPSRFHTPLLGPLSRLRRVCIRVHFLPAWQSRLEGLRRKHPGDDTFDVPNIVNFPNLRVECPNLFLEKSPRPRRTRVARPSTK